VDRVYRFNPATGEITPVQDWTAWGLSVAGLDAIDRLSDGTLAFSIEGYSWLTQAGISMILMPQNVYRFDPTQGTFELLFDGWTLGLVDLDGVDVLGNGSVAFSTTTDVWIMTATGGRLLRHQDVYVHSADNNVTLLVDGQARGLQSLDALDVEAMVLLFQGDTMLWSGLASDSGFDVVRGDLAALRSTAGDFSQSTVECLARDTDQSWLEYQPVPEQPGAGFWFLARETGKSWDSEGIAQVGSRDAGITASGVGCP
jgi:hypothetical protein